LQQQNANNLKHDMLVVISVQ